MGFIHYIGIFIVFSIIILIGCTTGKKGTRKNFSGERTANSMIVTGALVGTLVGGSSTIGTAQLAFNYGFSAWWFTLGGGIGVLILGFLYKAKLFERGIKTLPELVEDEYGKKCSLAVLLFNSLGTFLSVVAQVISSTALITSMAAISNALAVFITVVLIAVYVVFGGALSLGYAGTAKTILVSLSIAVCGVFAIVSQGGIAGFAHLDTQRYFNIIARGAFVDFGAGLSLIVGVLTTQSYISAVAMAKNKRELMGGTIITAILVPAIGVLGIFVGLYMRINNPDIDSKMALPIFILNKMPPIIGGIMLGTLLLAVIGTAAGLSFGIAKMFIDNFAKKSKKNEIALSRIFMIAVLIFAGILSLGDSATFILNWSFMSQGLRGAAAIIPFLTALYLPGKIDKKYVLITIIVGPMFTLIGKLFLPPHIDSLFLGIVVAFVIQTMGYLLSKKAHGQAV